MKTNYLASMLGALLVAACTSALPPDKSTTTITQAETRAGCALGMAGTTAMAEDVEGGIVVTFTNPREVKEVRERAFDASIMFGPSRLGKGHNGRHGEGGQHGLKPMQLPPAWASTTDVDGGARIRFTPVDKADLDTLRAKLHERMSAMNATCGGNHP